MVFARWVLRAKKSNLAVHFLLDSVFMCVLLLCCVFVVLFNWCSGLCFGFVFRGRFFFMSACGSIA